MAEPQRQRWGGHSLEEKLGRIGLLLILLLLIICSEDFAFNRALLPLLPAATAVLGRATPAPNGVYLPNSLN